MTFKVGNEEIEVDESNVTTYYSDEPNSPFHHCYQADAVTAINLDTDEHIKYRAHTVDGEWYFVKP
jgi:hypothetical protein